ncbi:hypothetical protein FRB94_004582 [Tulasnella sp. JGI-2019a]|nr:hypothetical protein FRB94_004582 [Tulasnella sp. JGI-2019a]KAG9030247.1 hypothetical protein FRB95_004183 [Tulasnella sp. JGI-2019a]
MDPAAVNQYVDRALACLMDGAMCCSKADGSSERQRIFHKFNFLQLSYKALTQQIHRHIVDTAQSLNSLAPIHSLPNELLATIIALVPTIGESHPRHLLALGFVSKYWNRVVFETPSLWAQISSNSSDAENRAVILRSKDFPLRVSYHRRGSMEFIDLVGGEAHRWQSAEFHPRYHGLLHKLVPLSVPLLEELMIDCGGVNYLPTRKGFDIELFTGGADRLRHVDIRYFPIPLNSHLLSRLVTLKMSGSLISSGASTSEITGMLRRCPELCTFKLEYSGKEEIPVLGGIPSEIEVAYLSALTSFTLRLENAKAAFSRILSSVRIPSCTQFDLRCCDPTSSIFSDTTCDFADVLLSTIQRLSEITLALSPSELKLIGSHDQNNLAISIYSEQSRPWEDLAQLIRRTGATVTWPPITAEIRCHEPLLFLHVADLLRKMTSIVKLHLVGNSDQYITLLADPMPSNGTHEWVLPNLKELSLEACPENSLQLLRELSRARNGVDNVGQRDRVWLGLPAKLKINVCPAWILREREPFYTALWELKGEDWEGDITDC